VAALAADGAVLALGDLTFMTEPYNAVYDNDRLVANIADFLSGAQRAYGLEDFPYFFGEQVDLVYTGDPTLDSDFLAGGGGLQTLFEEEGKTLTLRESEDGTRDTLFVGLYEEAEEVEPYLAAAQVTLLITPTRQLPALGATPTPISIQAPTSTLGITPTAPVTAEIAVTAEISPSAKHLVQIESLGQMVVTGTSLLVLQSAGERQVLLVLADTRPGLVKALELLSGGDLDACLRREAVTPTPSLLALCSTGEVKPGAGSGGWQESQPAEAPAPGPTPPPVAPSKPVTDTVAPPGPSGEPAGPSGAPEGRILIIAVDDGEARLDGRTSADDYAAILDNRYDLQVRSMAQDGPPDPAEVLQYDMVILTAGDYADAFGETESNLFLDLMLEGTPMILSGAYVGDGTIESVQQDIQVQDAGHPLARGFTAGEVITFVPAPSGSEVEPYVIDDIGEGKGSVIFVRGPDSEAAGTPSVFFLEDELNDLQILFIGFPLYLLPEGAKTRLVTNAVDWMLN
jgi:hypothetical protein